MCNKTSINESKSPGLRIPRIAIPLILVGLLCAVYLIQTTFIQVQAVKSERIHSRREDHQNSFVLSPINQSEQILSAIRNILQLGHLFKQVNASLVEPFVIGTKLYGLGTAAIDVDDSDALQHAQPLSKTLDLAKITQGCYDIQEPVSFNTFLRKSARRLVLLNPLTKAWISNIQLRKTNVNRKLTQCIKAGHQVCECGQLLDSYAKKVLKLLNGLNRDQSHTKYEFVRIICFNQLQPMTLSSLLQQSDIPIDYELSKSQPVSYMFTTWQGSSCAGLERGNNSDLYDIVEEEAVQAYQKREGPDRALNDKCPSTQRVHLVPEVSFPNKCTKMGNIGDSFVSFHYIKPHLKNFAVDFLNDQSLADVSKMVSIHFRTERLLHISRLSNQPAWIDCCMEDLNQLLGRISRELSIHNNSILVTDIGPYGSKSCRRKCNDTALADMISKLREQHQLTSVQFSPRTYNADDNPLTASLVEHLALAQGRYLVVIGGGAFQRAIVSSALQIGNVKRIYSVCSLTTMSSKGYPATVEHFSLNSCMPKSEINPGTWIV